MSAEGRVVEGDIDHDLSARVTRLEQKIAAIVAYFNHTSHVHQNGTLTVELAVLMGVLDDGAGAREHYLSRVPPVRRGW